MNGRLPKVDERNRPNPIAILALRLVVVWILLLNVVLYAALIGWRGGAFVMLAWASAASLAT